ncbi:MAG: hypothetical protein FJ347_09085 [Sphingomonadales bacterium]|nr:hypothetical protein [Sphingomonadales bacterium]
MLNNSIKTKLFKVYGKEIKYPKDCDALARDITQKTGSRISSSTVKRLLGFIKTNSHPNQYTLDTISNYLGYANWGGLSDENNDEVNGIISGNPLATSIPEEKKKRWLLALIIVTIGVGLFTWGAKNYSKPETLTFKKLPSLPQPRCGGRAVVSNNIIYYLGGFNCGLTTHNTWCFDVKNNRWKWLMDMPVSKAEMATASVGDRIYCFGGWLGNNLGATDKSEVYDIKSNTWDTLPNLPEKFTGASAVAIDKDIYIVGAKTGETSSFFFKFNTVNKGFTPLPLYHGGLIHMSMVACNNKIYLMGGSSFQNMKHAWHNNLYEFDIRSNRWTEKAKMPVTVSKSAAVAIHNKIHLLGGIDQYENGGSGIKEIHMIYDIEHDTWSEGPVLSTPICQHQAVQLGKTTLIMGGITFFPNPLNTVFSIEL